MFQASANNNNETKNNNAKQAGAKTKSPTLAKQDTTDDNDPIDGGFFEAAGRGKKSFESSVDAPLITPKLQDDNSSKMAKLALEETDFHHQQQQSKSLGTGYCPPLVAAILCKRCILITLVVALSLTLIYALPIIRIDPKTPQRVPRIPFDFNQGPLKASDASLLQAEKLFEGQLYAPESLAFDSFGNLFTAIEGGYVLYARLNKSAPIRRAFYDQALLPPPQAQPLAPASSQQQQDTVQLPTLIKIADLNQPTPAQKRLGSERKECFIDEQLYGPSPASNNKNVRERHSAAADGEFSSNIAISRCSKPLGIRLSVDEAFLYVVDTLKGLYKVDLRRAERSGSPLRQVNLLIDFKPNKPQMLQIYDPQAANTTMSASAHYQLFSSLSFINSSTQLYHLNATLMAIDDLAIDSGASSSRAGGDVIYMTCASQFWRAVSVFYDILEGRPTGLVLRYDTGTNELRAFDPFKMAHVRASYSGMSHREQLDYPTMAGSGGIGAPRLDENDHFDDRPLFFPNGIQLMDDKSALLFTETLNRRILKHYIRGPRAGTTDHFAWTPIHPDNIRRSSDKSRETYWLVGCSDKVPAHEKCFNLMDFLHDSPVVRKLIAKTIYLFGASIELVGGITSSLSITNFGYTIKTGELITPSVCEKMIALQYDASGELINSVHSDSLPKEYSFFSQADEIVDNANQTNTHYLYLGSPAYTYIARLTLPPPAVD